MEQILSNLPNSPVVSFTILLLVILIVPPIFERLRLPGLVGLLLAGVVLGQDGLQLLDAKSETTKLLSDIGKIYLMFVAGLEIDLEEFRKKKNRSLGFGAATFLLPLLGGMLVGKLFGFSWNGAVLMGSLLASHTLLGYPIVKRLGVAESEPVVVTIGATIFTDIAALLVLAICVSVHAGEFSLMSLVIQLVSLGIYAIVVLYGLDKAGKSYFQRTGDDEGNQFLFVLLAVFLASMGAELIHVDKIVGAFLAGLAVNDVVGDGPVKEKVEFVGSVLFIPIFFVSMGLLLNVSAFISTLQSSLALPVAVVTLLFVSKLAASFLAKLVYRYNWQEMLTMWSLSIPQVAATLAAALAAYEAVAPNGDRLISAEMFNSVIVLMLVTALAGPVLTARFASKLELPVQGFEKEDGTIWWESQEDDEAIALDSEPAGFSVVVPVCNPLTERFLVEMGALLAQHEAGTVIPLSVVMAQVHMDEPLLNASLRRSQQLLDRAVHVSREFQVPASGEIRIDDDVAHGISRTARETNASLILMGWSETTGLRARLFGTVVDSVFWSAHCPVAMVRLLDDPVNIHRILVPVKNLTPQAIRAVRFAQLFADSNQAEVILLHVCDRRTPEEQIDAFEKEMSHAFSQVSFSGTTSIKTIPGDEAAPVILEVAKSVDMVVLRSVRRRTAGGLSVSDVTTQVIKELTCSLVLFGEPHS
ncbi:cation:proton antiporter [Geitlerinema sp. PCC 9228]|jgi:Kef-type K+ transport system membrane component KefB/nucleotide-binding universal stress UspA family protein|uniref:cation:proton antiporter domain-containing protein n=1 Tax=Geitlerinema sp. PCC 9228 TaxID=111611 RepID=UPI0008F99D56|nr:cation:proton antiporter [Geitlerinema sp. PCC 9228]